MTKLGLLFVTVVVASACGGDVQTIEVEFDGSECIADLPGSIPAGDHTFLLANSSDRTSLPVYVVELANGHTYGEFAALQEAPGVYFPLPDWAAYGLRDLTVTEVAADGQRRFGFSLEPGEHAVYLWASYPQGLWLCGSLTVNGTALG